MKKKIAIVTSGYLPVPATKGGGVEVLDEYLIKENEKYDYADLTIFSSDDEEARKKSEEYTNTKIVFVVTPKSIKIIDKIIFFFVNKVLKKANSNSYRYIAQRIFYILKVSKEISNKKFDRLVLENHATLFSVLRYHNNFKRYQGRYYFHLHNEVKNSFGNEKYIQNVTKVLGVSNYINSTLKGKYPNMKNSQFVVVRNAVDHKRFALDLSDSEKLNIRKNLGISKDKFVFLFTGRLNKEKGIMEAVEAFKKANLSNAIFLIVGSSFFDTDIKSDFEVKLQRLVKSMGNKIKFTGYIPNEQLGRIYAIADVCVIPSIWEDPAPLTIIEAITAGKAIITTDSGGIPEYVNEKNALILKRNSKIVYKLENSMRLVDAKDICEKMRKESTRLNKNINLKKFASDFFESLN